MVGSEDLVETVAVPATSARCSLRALYSASWVRSCCMTSAMGTAWSIKRSPGLNGRIKCRMARVLTVTLMQLIRIVRNVKREDEIY